MNILVIAPHPDDEILGVGGTIAKRIKANDKVYVCVATKGVMPLFTPESVEVVREECLAANKLLGTQEVKFLDFPAAMLETVPRHELNDALSRLIQEIKPEEVYIPHRGDMQLDHKMIVDAAMVALRPKYSHVVKRIYAYETLSETGWDVPNSVNEFIPNVYEDIDGFLDIKLEAMSAYKSQLSVFPGARSVEAVEALAKFRGATVNAGAAEAFCLIREIK